MGLRAWHNAMASPAEAPRAASGAASSAGGAGAAALLSDAVHGLMSDAGADVDDSLDVDAVLGMLDEFPSDPLQGDDQHAHGCAPGVAQPFPGAQWAAAVSGSPSDVSGGMPSWGAVTHATFQQGGRLTQQAHACSAGSIPFADGSAGV